MRKLILLTVFLFALSAQSQVFSYLKVTNTPTTINDTTQVDVIVRQKTGANTGVFRKVTWGYLASLFNSGGGTTPNLDEVMEQGSTASIATDISINNGGFNLFGGTTGFVSLSAQGVMSIAGANNANLSSYNQDVRLSAGNGRIRLFTGNGDAILSTSGLSTEKEFIFPNMAATQNVLPISVNGQFASSTGDITIDTGIPLTGTEVGNPVTGDIVSEATISATRFEVSSFDVNPVIVLKDDGGIGQIEFNDTENGLAALIDTNGILKRNTATGNQFQINYPSPITTNNTITFPEETGTVALQENNINLTLSANTNTSPAWNNKIVYIDNGANNITITVNDVITTAFVKLGTGSITIAAGTKTVSAVDSLTVSTGSKGCTFLLTPDFSATDNTLLFVTNR